ncbi:MAG: transketolase [Bacteroidales bacterium]|nr:transketolase [Bacteroidales bacterium]
MGETTTLGPTTPFTDMDNLAINAIRTLSMDAVQQANSGHPGAPMGLAPLAYTLWNRFLKYDPADPSWPARDRFVLSNGHASMLLYSLLHLAGVKNGPGSTVDSVPMSEIMRFRQLHSRTAGHPESHITAGVETTTGPLGQGIGNAVGMAIAQKWIAATFSKPGFEDLFDFHIYAICGDGCMMEGIASEASSLAGHLQLDNLTLLYDDNTITIEGHTDLAFSENVAARYAAYGWHVLHVEKGNVDTAAIAAALADACQTRGKPTLVDVKTLIGYGAPHKQNTHAAHGEPLGDAEIALAKKFYGWPEDKKFYVPDGVYERFQAGIGQRGATAHAAWSRKFAEYKKQFPELAATFERMQAGELPPGWDQDIPTFPADAKGIATRDSGGTVLNAVAKNVPWLIGGAADLAPSTKTLLKFDGAGAMQAATPAGRNMHFGIREHAMGAIMNGMVLTKVRPYGSGFLIFSDYGRPSIRLAALMEIPVIYIFTHDSIGVGEDGPTHQPIEQVGSLRMIPNLVVIRPADANEVAEAWKAVMPLQHHPVAFALTRQALPTLDRTHYASAAGVARGGYVLADAPDGKPEILLIGTGSEVQLCVAAYEKLTAEGVQARVISLPSWEWFESQPQEYRDSVIPPAVTKRVCVEMASTFGWERYAGATGAIIGMHTFGASAPLKDLLKEFGFSVDTVYAAAKQQLQK